MMKSPLIAALALAFGGVVWGLIWIPLRMMEDGGLEGTWPSLVSYAAVFVLMLPVALYRWRHYASSALALIGIGSFTGIAFALYGTAVLLTEVNRAILLFYLLPVWGTLIGLFFLGERFTLRRGMALLFGGLGMLLVLDLGEKLPWPRNAGDWMAVLGGIFFACGSTVLFRNKQIELPEQVGSFVFGGFIMSGLLILIAGGKLGAVPSPDVVISVWKPILVMAIITVPMILLTSWPATLLPPGRVGLLLMTEVVVGLASAMILEGESLSIGGWIGAALIISATIIEVTGHSSAMEETA